MKNLFKVNIIIAICLLITACEGISQSTPTTDLSLDTTPAQTVSPTPTPLPTFVVIPTQTSAPSKLPTLLPTIEPALIPGLLRNSLFIQTSKEISVNNVKQITGWEYGLSYEWLDSTHMRLYPRTGQISNAFAGRYDDLFSQPVIINIEGGHIWLPEPSKCISIRGCDPVYWSRELGVLITTGSSPSSASGEKDATFIYSVEGEFINQYWGKLLDISPSGTKILVEDDTLIDLRTNKTVDLNWYIDYFRGETPGLFWSPDESRVYKCCFYYGDTETGESYSFKLSDFKGFNSKESPYIHSYGQWVRNNDYFLIEWSWLDDGDQRYLPMFNPEAKIYYDVREKAGVPSDLGCPETSGSPNGMYIVLMCWDGSYLINLENFHSTAYPYYIIDDIEWSSDGNFAWVKALSTNLWQILSVSNGELKSLAVNPVFDTPLWWHPTDNALAYVSDNRQKLILVNAKTMLVQELELPTTFSSYLDWSPSGEYIALTAEDGSLWLVDYPKLENLEQLTTPMPKAGGVNWSPDGNSIAFVSGTDIYIIDASQK